MKSTVIYSGRFLLYVRSRCTAFKSVEIPLEMGHLVVQDFLDGNGSWGWVIVPKEGEYGYLRTIANLFAKPCRSCQRVGNLRHT